MWKFYLTVLLASLLIIGGEADKSVRALGDCGQFASSADCVGEEIAALGEHHDIVKRDKPSMVGVAGKVHKVLNNVLKMKANLKKTKLQLIEKKYLTAEDAARFQKALKYMSDRLTLNTVEDRLILLTQSKDLLQKNPEAILEELRQYEIMLEVFKLKCEKLLLTASGHSLAQGRGRSKRDTDNREALKSVTKRDTTDDIFHSVSSRLASIAEHLQKMFDLLNVISKKTGVHPKALEVELNTLKERLQVEVLAGFNYFQVNRHCTKKEEIQRMVEVMDEIDQSLFDIKQRLTQTTTASTTPTTTPATTPTTIPTTTPTTVPTTTPTTVPTTTPTTMPTTTTTVPTTTTTTVPTTTTTTIPTTTTTTEVPTTIVQTLKPIVRVKSQPRVEDEHVIASMISMIKKRAKLLQDQLSELKIIIKNAFKSEKITPEEARIFYHRVSSLERFMEEDILEHLVPLEKQKGNKYPQGTVVVLMQLETDFDDIEKEFTGIWTDVEIAEKQRLQQVPEAELLPPKRPNFDVDEGVGFVPKRKRPIVERDPPSIRRLGPPGLLKKTIPDYVKRSVGDLRLSNNLPDVETAMLGEEGNLRRRRNVEERRVLQTVEEQDAAEAVFQALVLRVETFKKTFKQMKIMLSNLYKKTGQIPKTLIEETSSLENIFKSEVLPGFAYFKVNRHCTEAKDVETMMDTMENLQESLETVTETVIDQLTQPKTTTTTVPTTTSTPAPTPKAFRPRDTINAEDQHIIAGTIQMIRTRTEPLRQGLALLQQRVVQALKLEQISTEESQIFLQRIANLEQFISTDILTKLTPYEKSRGRYREGTMNQLRHLESNLDDIELEFNSILNDFQYAAVKGEAAQLEPDQEVPHAIKKRSIDEGAIDAEVDIVSRDLQDSVEAVKEKDVKKVKKAGIIAAIFSIFGLLTVGVFTCYLVYHCKYARKKKQVKTQEELASKRSQGSFRSNRSQRSL